MKCYNEYTQYVRVRYKIKFGWLSLLKPLQRVTIAQTTTRHDRYVRFSTKPAAKLLWNYLKECIKNNQETSVQGVYVFTKKQTRAYVVLLKCKFSYIHALNMFRTAVRRGHSVLWSHAHIELYIAVFYGVMLI